MVGKKTSARLTFPRTIPGHVYLARPRNLVLSDGTPATGNIGFERKSSMVAVGFLCPDEHHGFKHAVTLPHCLVNRLISSVLRSITSGGGG